MENKIDVNLNYILNSLENMKLENAQRKMLFDKNLVKMKDLTSIFKNKFEILINSLSQISEITEDEIEAEDSPASQKVSIDINFPNEEKIYTHLKDSTDQYKGKTFSCHEPLPINFIVELKLNKMNCGNLCIGVSEELFDTDKTYLGGDVGEVCFAIAGNKALGHNKQWVGFEGLPYKAGDIITLKGENGVITYAVNDVWDNKTFNLSYEKIHLSFSFYSKGDEIEILSCSSI